MSHSMKVPFCALPATGILKAVAILSILIITLAGCTTLRNKKTMNTEEVL